MNELQDEGMGADLMMKNLMRGFAIVLGWMVLQTPLIARACAVCSAGKDEENADAFLWSTLFMSVMPLAAIGTLVYVLYKKMQKLEQETERGPDGLPLRRSRVPVPTPDTPIA
ncbi:MAG: hypothetical protein QMC74_12855 [Myxococcota bacterium]|jgi:hypothetical protein